MLGCVHRPLSLQVHPDEATASVGCQREDVAGVLVDDPRRCFPDGRAKPEAVCAVGQFETLCGFRPILEAQEMAATSNLPERVLGPLRSGDWSTAVASAFAAPPEEVAAVAAAAEAGDGPAAGLVGRLAAIHHGDPALLLVPLLRHHVLDDGDLLYVAPGVPHAHLSGLAVEVMADSDDVVRAGLTSKFVDPMVLVGLLRPERLVDAEKRLRELKAGRAMGEVGRNSDCPQFCDACFTGDYPIKLASGLSTKRVSHGTGR